MRPIFTAARALIIERMLGEFDLDARSQSLVGRLVESFKSDERTRHIGRGYLPSRPEIIHITELLLEVAYPGYYGRQDLSDSNLEYHIGELLPRLGRGLYLQIFRSLCHQNEIDGNYDPAGSSEQALPLDAKARGFTDQFLEQLVEIRNLLAFDVQAAYDGDPAAVNTDEVIMTYPGLLAVSIFRFAHALHEMNVPVMPRAMTEWAHQRTGIDIHPGAKIGRSFFIDHGTGVVIGETTEIGDNVKIYQGVTLGALSFLKDERGRMVKGYKRHPTVRNNVTIYANAIILGGDTILGEGCTIGGSTFLTSSVPAGCTVTTSPPELNVRAPKMRGAAAIAGDFVV